MSILNTILGEVNVNDARIVRASGFGGYSIVIDFTFEGANKTINLHSTDSELFDEANGEENHSKIVLEKACYVIENAVVNYVNSL